jgi:hypothetical protein
MGAPMTNKYKKHSQVRASRAVAKEVTTCKSKRAWDTAEEAAQKGMKVYQCQYCNKFHRASEVSSTLLGRHIPQNRGKRNLD